jgi:hypothetical protein
MPVVLEVRSDVELALLGWLPVPAPLQVRPGVVARFIIREQSRLHEITRWALLNEPVPAPSWAHILEVEIGCYGVARASVAGPVFGEHLAFVIGVEHFAALRNVPAFIEFRDVG